MQSGYLHSITGVQQPNTVLPYKIMGACGRLFVTFWPRSIKPLLAQLIRGSVIYPGAVPCTVPVLPACAYNITTDHVWTSTGRAPYMTLCVTVSEFWIITQVYDNWNVSNMSVPFDISTWLYSYLAFAATAAVPCPHWIAVGTRKWLSV